MGNENLDVSLVTELVLIHRGRVLLERGIELIVGIKGDFGIKINLEHERIAHIVRPLHRALASSYAVTPNAVSVCH